MITRLARQGREILLPANVFGRLGDHLGRAAESLLRHRAWWPKTEPERTMVNTAVLVVVVALGLLAGLLTLAGWTVVAVRLAAERVWERRQLAGQSRGWR